MQNKTLIHCEDLLPIKIEIKLRNLFTDTIVSSNSNKKIIENVSISRSSRGRPEGGKSLVQLLEILPNGLVISVPKYTCALRHVLEIDIKVAHMSKSPMDIRV